MPDWPPHMRALIEWYRANREKLPTGSFPLGLGETVLDAEGFYRSLDRDIACGPRGSRAAGLEKHLEVLRDTGGESVRFRIIS